MNVNTGPESEDRESTESTSSLLSRCVCLRSIGALAWVVFGVALVVFLVQSRHLTKPGYEDIRERSFLLSGDEPWYLIATRSMALDLDYNLYDDFKEGGHREFYPKDDIAAYGPERLRKLGHGRHATPEFWETRRYPIVRIGLPILLAPAYRVGLVWDGQVRVACVWFLCVVGALLVQQMFLMGWDLTSSRVAAAVGALAGGFAVPIILYVTQIYTEFVAALLVVVACRMLFISTGPVLVRAIIAGVCVAYLPWLHDKYYLVVLIFMIGFFVAMRPVRLKSAIGFWAPVLLSLVLQAAYYHTLHGVIYPITDHQAITLGAGVRGGFLGVLFDRTDGLVPYWPVAAFAIAGFVFMLRDRKPAAPWLVALTAAHWLSVGMFTVWTGGPVPPVRYMLPVVPLLVVGSIYALARMRRPWLVALMGAAMVLAIVIGARNISHPRTLQRDTLPLVPGAGTLGSKAITKLYNVFPDMKVLSEEHGPGAGDHARAVAWLVLTAGLVVLVVWLERRRVTEGPTRDETMRPETRDTEANE